MDDTTDNNNGNEPLNNNDTNNEGVSMNDTNDNEAQHDTSSSSAASNNTSQGAPSIQNETQDDAPSITNNTNNNTANNNNHVTFSSTTNNNPTQGTQATTNSNNQIIRQQSTTNSNNNSIHPTLPFLITHWLSNYTAASTLSSTTSSSTTATSTAANGNREKERALQTIQNQAIILANAFETLGEFGTSSTQQLSTSSSGLGRLTTEEGVMEKAEGTVRSTTYSDLKRKYSPLLQIGNGISARGIESCTGAEGISLLDKLVSSSTTSTPLSEELHLPWSLLLSSYENSIPSEREMSDATTLASLGTSGLMSILPNGNVLRRLSSPGGSGNSSPIRGGRKRGVFSGAGRRLGEGSGGMVVQIERSSIPLRELSVIQTMSAAQGKCKQLCVRDIQGSSGK